MATTYNDNNQVNAPKALDNKRGKFSSGVWRAYNNVAEALASVTFRHVGLTVDILKDGVLTEYWWRDNTTDEGLIEKTSSGEITIDPTPTNGSDNAVASNGVFDALATKQDTLVSGTNIKTINGTAVLGSGDITISSGTIDAVPTDGSSNAVSSNGTFDSLALKAPLASPALTGVPTAPTASNGTNTTQIATTAFVLANAPSITTDPTPTDGSTNPVQSNGVFDALATKEPTITAGTTAQYYRGDKTFQTLDKTAVGLSNVDNTSDATKNSATATLINKTISGASNTLSNISQSSIINQTFEVGVACSDETSDLTSGTSKVTFRIPFAITITEVYASVNTAPTGSTLVVDINESGTTILSTKLSIDATEKTSVTAASQAVISDASIAADAEITIDIDQVGAIVPGKGLKVFIKGTR